MAARGRFLNAGQSCISPKRLIVDASVAEEFTRLLVAEVEALTVGDPEAPGTRRRADGPRGPARRRAPAGRGVGRGRRPAADRRPPARRARVLLRADRADRRRARPARLRRGDLRSGRRGDRRRRGRRRGPDRQRHPVRPRRQRLDGRPRARDRRRPADPLGRRLRQRASSPPTSACPSAAPGPAATAGSWPRPASASSSTSAPGGFSTSPPSPHRRPSEPDLPPRACCSATASGRRSCPRRCGWSTPPWPPPAPTPVDWQELPLGASAIEAHGSAIPAATVEALAGLDGWLLGPHDSAAYPEPLPVAAEPERRAPQALRPVRERPARRARFEGGTAIAPDTDLVIVRENTEGFYADRNTYAGTGEYMPTRGRRDHDGRLHPAGDRADRAHRVRAGPAPAEAR